MSAETELYSALNVAGVTSLVSDRIYPDALPEDCVYPAIVFARTNTTPVVSIGSQHFADFVDFGVSVWGKTRTQVDTVASAVEVALRVAGHEITNREAGFDPDTGLVATTITVTVAVLTA